MLAGSFLALSLLALMGSWVTYFRLRSIGPLLVPAFVIGWLRGELALQVMVAEVLIVVGFVASGAHESAGGQLALVVYGVSWGLLGASFARSLGARREIEAALAPVGLTLDRDVSAFHGFPNPFRFGHPDVRRILDVAYGESLPGDQGGRNLLDLVVPKDAVRGDRRPVLLQVHGGAWMIGDKREQGRPLMTELAQRGWICVAQNYRLSPRATMPDHIVDVKRAIAWLRENIAEYGGDPDFVCITGGSAGGHLCSLAALSPNDPRFQPGFESVDTRVRGCVPFYGVFDFLDRADDRGKAKMADMLGPRVFKCRPEDNAELWDSVCPVTRVQAEAPPFFVIQGSHDSLVFAEEAVTFVEALREKSAAPVLHAELEGGQHAFEIFHSPRSRSAVLGAVAFLERLRADHEAGRAETPLA